jgi:RHS repeat-associated protein
LTRTEYDVFGLQTGGNGSSNSIGYTGQRLDNETGLMALGNGERYYSPSYARFIQQDSFSGSMNTPQNMNRYAYTHNNPNKYTDPTGHWIESAWDAFSLGLGIYSFQDNIRQGNYLAAAVDAVGIVADTAALILPIVPGGVGAGIKAYRAVDKVVTVVQTMDRTVNTIQATYNAGEAFGNGDIKGGLLNTAFSLLGAKGAGVSANDYRKISNATDTVQDVGKTTQKATNEATDILNAKNNPEQLTGIFQKEAKTQKASMLDDIKAKDNVKTDYSDNAINRKLLGDGGRGQQKLLGNGKTFEAHLDANHLTDAFNHWRNKKRFDVTERAWNVLSDARTSWKVNPEAFMEFHKGLSQAEKRAIPAFLKRIDAQVLNKTEAANLQANPVFSQVTTAMMKASGGNHKMDIRHAAYAAADGLPFVGDRKFENFVNNSFATGKHGIGITHDVRNIKGIADMLGY